MEQIKGDLFSFSRGYGFNVARGLTLDLTPDHLLEPHTTRRVLEYSLSGCTTTLLCILGPSMRHYRTSPPTWNSLVRTPSLVVISSNRYSPSSKQEPSTAAQISSNTQPLKLPRESSLFGLSNFRFWNTPRTHAPDVWLYQQLSNFSLR